MEQSRASWSEKWQKYHLAFLQLFSGDANATTQYSLAFDLLLRLFAHEVRVLVAMVESLMLRFLA
jgi:hypothetical protein